MYYRPDTCVSAAHLFFFGHEPGKEFVLVDLE
jgi:hypothetical protein